VITNQNTSLKVQTLSLDMINLSKLIFSLVMGCLMSLSITLATTFARLGAVDNFFAAWMEVWFVAYPVAIIGILVYRPFAAYVTAILVEKIDSRK